MSDWRVLSACPLCGATDPRPIHYGLPDDVGLRSAEQGILTLGGCDVWGEMPIVHCRQCGHEWGRPIEGIEQPPDLIADRRSVSLEELCELLEDAGWSTETRQNHTDGNEAKAEILFTKPGTRVQVELWFALNVDDICLWIHGCLDDPREADSVYGLLASAGLINPTRSRPWWQLPLK